MISRKLNWDDIRYFLALCRQGTISGAGAVLGVKHTTVARRIKALETQLGTRLFDRMRSGYAMTQAAENLFGKALEMESIALAANRDLAGQDAELAGPLSFTVAHDFADRLLIAKLSEFLQLYPAIKLQLITTTSLIDLALREADIAVRLTSSPPDFLTGREIMKLKHGIYAGKRTITETQAPIKVILFRSEIEMPNWVNEYFPSAEVALRVDSVATMALAVKNNLGYAKLPCYIGDLEPEILRMNIQLPTSTWGIWLLSHVDLRTTARVRVCREFIAQTIEQQRHIIHGERSRYASND